MEGKAQIAYAVIVDLVQEKALILDVFGLLMPQDEMLVDDLDCILLIAVFVPCQDNLSKATVSKSPYQLKIGQCEGHPGTKAKFAIQLHLLFVHTRLIPFVTYLGAVNRGSASRS